MKLSEITPEIYRERVAQACEFLEGHSREMMAELEKQMRAQAQSRGENGFRKGGRIAQHA